jgi:hypothetical protein
MAICASAAWAWAFAAASSASACFSRGEIGRVDLDEQIALLHELVVGDVHLEHRAGDTGGHRDYIGVDLGVVGVFTAA